MDARRHQSSPIQFFLHRADGSLAPPANPAWRRSRSDGHDALRGKHTTIRRISDANCTYAPRSLSGRLLLPFAVKETPGAAVEAGVARDTLDRSLTGRFLYSER